MPKKLSIEETARALESNPGWKLKASTDPVRTTTTCLFKDFQEALDFTKRE
jgi:pterin-4a-carbinolamine dehydratase